jgi:hypothetical protein
VIEAVTVAIIAMMHLLVASATVPATYICSQTKWHVWNLTLVKHGVYAPSYASR